MPRVSKERAYTDGQEVGQTLSRIHRKSEISLLSGKSLLREADRQYDRIAGLLSSPYFYSDTEAKLHYIDGFIDGYTGKSQDGSPIIFEYRPTGWQQFWKWVQSLFSSYDYPKDEQPLE